MATAIAFDPDAGLLRDLAKGSRASREQSLRQLMDRHAAHLHATACRLLGDPALAEDIVQVSFLKAWTKASDWAPGTAKFGTWLTRVTINACLDELRKKRVQLGEDGHELPDTTPNAEHILMRRDTRTDIEAAMCALPERQRTALTLSVFEELTQAEGALAMRITEGAYESLLVRARRRLRDVIMERQNAV